MSKNLVILTSLEDVKKTAELVMKADPDITGWKFTDKVSIGCSKYGFFHNVTWAIQVWVEYNNNRPVLRNYIFHDGDYEGFLTRCTPHKDDKYIINPVFHDNEYHSFEVMSIDSVPAVKTTYYFHDYPWEKAKCVEHPEYCPDRVSSFYDKPIMFPNKDCIKMIETHYLKEYKHFEPKLVDGIPCWVAGHPLTSRDQDYIHFCYIMPHICYRTEHMLPIGAYRKTLSCFDEIEIGKEYPLYRLGDYADVSTSNLISVTFDGEQFNYIRPGKSKLIWYTNLKKEAKPSPFFQ